MKKGGRYSPGRAGLPANCASVLCAALLLTATVSARAASNDAKRTCVQAAEKGQELRTARRLLQAEARFRECAADSCPAAVRDDCRSWALELRAEIPTIVVRAEDAKGRELRGRVLVDDVVVREVYDGAPIPVEVGAHTVSVEADGGVRATVSMTALAGEQHRRVVAVLPPQPPAGEPLPVPSQSGRLPLSSVLLGVVGAAAMGSFAYFGLTARADAAHLRSTCAPHCASKDVDSIRTRLLVADVSLGVGVVSLAAAAWLWFGAGARTTPGPVTAGAPRIDPPRRPALSVDLRPNVLGLSLRGEF